MERRFKVCLLGEGRVGKTSILLRYVKNAFDERQVSTLTASCFDKQVPLGNGESVRVSVWDTAGQERFHALGPLYYRDADGALLVYDITDEASFTRVKDWVKELRKMLSDELCIAIAGNKCDMEKSRHVDKDEVLLYCASVGATHHLTSAKTGAGVSEAFTELMRRVASKKKPAPALGGGGSGGLRAAPAEGGAGAAARLKLAIVDDEPEKKEKKGGCC